MFKWLGCKTMFAFRWKILAVLVLFGLLLAWSNAALNDALTVEPDSKNFSVELAPGVALVYAPEFPKDK